MFDEHEVSPAPGEIAADSHPSSAPAQAQGDAPGPDKVLPYALEYRDEMRISRQQAESNLTWQFRDSPDALALIPDALLIVYGKPDMPPLLGTGGPGPGWTSPLPCDGGLKWTCLADISAKPVDWLWYPYIMRAANNLLAGDNDIGKSKTTASIAAAVTKGGGLPGMPQRDPASVVMLCAEEDPASMVKPDLIAAGADCSKIYLLGANVQALERGRLKTRMLCLQQDIAAISQKITEIGDVALIVVSPITSYLGEKVDANNGSAIRQLFLCLQQLAEQHKLAILLIHHYGKGNNPGYRAKEKILNSVQFVASARAAIVIERDPGDDARRLWLPVKANLVPQHDRVAKSFVFETAYIDDGNGEIQQGRIVWDAEDLHITADEVQAMASIKTKQQDSDSKQGEILSLLKAKGPLSSKQIAESLHNCCLSRTDKRWSAVRMMLGRMVTDKLIIPAGRGAYTLPDYL